MANGQSREEKQRFLLSRIQEMCYFDDEFMTKCLEDYPEGVELILRIIMGNNKLVVKEAQVQAVIKNLQGRSIRMDVKTNDTFGKQYDVEIQRADSGAKPKRARYNSSLMDANAILHRELADRARYFKEDEEGQKIMSKIMEEIVNGEKIEAAKRMLERGKLTMEEISEDLGLPLSVVEKLASNLQLVSMSVTL